MMFMVRMPKDIAIYFGRIDGQYVYYNNWKYEIVAYSEGKKEYILKLIGKVKGAA